MIATEQRRPLPVRPRPRPGETTATYIQYLARANHLPVRYLRRYLSASRIPAGPAALDRLAALSGRTVTALQHALTDLSCSYCGTPLSARARGRTSRWCSRTCALRAFRQRQRGKPERGDPAATPRATCRQCGTPITQKPSGRPAQWCSARCRQRARRQRLKTTARDKAIETSRGIRHPRAEPLRQRQPRPSQLTYPFPGRGRQAG